MIISIGLIICSKEIYLVVRCFLLLTLLLHVNQKLDLSTLFFYILTRRINFVILQYQPVYDISI